MTHSETDEDTKAKLQFQATFDIAEITMDTDLSEAQLDCVIKAWTAGASYAMKLAKQIMQEQV